MPQSTYRSFIGIAKEAKPAAGVLPTGVAPTFYIPVTKYDPNDRINYLFDKAWRGSQALDANAVAGPRWAEVDMSGDVFADAIGFPLAGILGDVVTSGTTPITHAIALLNSGTGQPVSYSLTDANPAQVARRVIGCQFESVSLKFDANGLFTYDAKAQGFASTVVSVPTSSFTGLAPAPGWAAVCSVAASSVTNLISMQLDIKRKVAPIHTADGTQDPYAIWAGDLEVTGKAKFIMEDETAAFAAYLNNTQPALEFNYTSGAGASQQIVKLHGSKTAFVVGKVDRSKDYEALDVDFRMLANSTDAGASGGLSPIKCSIGNVLVSGTYA